MTNAIEFQRKLAIMNCLNGRDFEAIFGESWEHYATKFWEVYNQDIAKFVMYLDSGNLKKYMNFVDARFLEYEKKYA